MRTSPRSPSASEPTRARRTRTLNEPKRDNPGDAVTATVDRTARHHEVSTWATTAARAADDKKASDVLVLDVGAVLAITDYFVLASAPNTRQVRTIADAVEEQVRQAGGPSPRRVEGLDELRWVLLDYGDFVVHVFFEETRRFYDLERLWADVPRVDWR